jgi:SAM-dependent methyltransferase
VADGRSIVARGYDSIAEAYLSYRSGAFTDEERAFLDRVCAAFPEHGDVLELGCGAGEPITPVLARRGHVTGIDISHRQVMLARRRVPDATFLLGDMTSVAFRSSSFSAVVAFASITHVPRDSHAELFQRIASWLGADGIFAGELGRGDNPGELTSDWMGAPMYWSHFDADHTLRLLRNAGFDIREASAVRGLEPDGTNSSWLGVIAQLKGLPRTA